MTECQGTACECFEVLGREIVEGPDVRVGDVLVEDVGAE